MIARLNLLFRLALTTFAIFIIQKPLFMLYNQAIYPQLSISEIYDVMVHAIPLDLTMTGYLVVFPWLLITLSFFIKHQRALHFVFSYLLPVYLALIAAIITIIFVSDTALYEFWKFKIDATVFNYIDKPAEAMASVSLPYLLVYFGLNIVLSALTAWIYIKVSNSIKIERTERLWHSTIMMPIAALIFIAIRGGFGSGTACVANVYFSKVQFFNHSAVNPCFNLFYSYSHSKNFAEEFRYMDSDDCETIVKEIYPTKDNTSNADTEILLTKEKPNILLVIWEGCGSQAVKYLGGEDITPGLCEIADDGILFNNCYSNSFRTDRGLLCILTGWLGLPSASLMKMPEKYTKLPGLANSLRKEGYSTEFWYGGDISFTNMGGFALDNGFEKTISDKDFDLKDRRYSKWGVVDGVLFDRLTDDIINDKSKQTSPWFTTVLTLSSHEPWEVPFKKFDSKQKNAFAYTDKVIKQGIDQLKETALWDNTLVVIVSDHGYLFDQTSPQKEAELIHIPLILTGGAIKNHGTQYDMIMNQSDIPATLLAQLGLSHDEFLFSRDILNKEYKYPTALNTSISIYSFVDSTGVTTYDFAGETRIYESEPDNSDTRTNKGKAVLQYLYDQTEAL